MHLSKSKYCNAFQCYKMLWLDKNMPEKKGQVSRQSILDNGTEVGELAKDLFGSHINIDFNNNLNIMIENTENVISENKKCNITEASFIYDDNFCSVDILRKNNDIYEIYEVKSSTELKDIYVEDASYQYYVLSKLGLTVAKVCVVYINSSYVRYGDLDLAKLFIIEDITEKVKSKINDVENRIQEIKKYMLQKVEPKDDIGIHCVKPYDCPFFEYCTRKLEKPNVFDINSMRNSTKFNLYHKGIYTFNDLIKEDLNWKYKEQIDFEINNKIDKVDKDEIEEFMNTLTYPLYFLDFETFQQSIPMYDGISPYQQIPFQYSLHYIDSINGTLEHKEFLAEAGIDPRRSLAESLVKDIPLNVCTLAYNMSFEKTVIKNLAELYPDLSEHLLNIRENIKDLMVPFYNRNYYTKDMQGSYSIKYVLPALFPNDPSLNYHNLDQVHNGSEAMSAYANMVNLSEKEQKELRYNLLKYCELDTYAMVKIWEKLKEV